MPRSRRPAGPQSPARVRCLSAPPRVHERFDGWHAIVAAPSDTPPARFAQSVRNPHVVSVRSTGEHDGLPYLAAQFIEGISLDQKLEQEGRLDLATTVRICAQVADGLQALWEAGMVHRDV